jgi:hypothetical protein
MEIHRKVLFDLLGKVQTSALKEGAPEHKIATGLKKILTKHIKVVPGDSKLMEIFLEKGTVPFCHHVLSVLKNNISASFSSASTVCVTVVPGANTDGSNKGNKGNRGNRGSGAKSEWRKLAITITKRVEVDAEPEPLPSPEELRRHYHTVLSSVLQRYPDLQAPPEGIALYRKGLVGGPYEYLTVPPPLVHFLSLVQKEEVDAPVFSLLDRLERFLLPSLLAFLPISETVEFLHQQWDGSDEALLVWERDHYHTPLLCIVQEESWPENEKQTRLQPLLHHWARVERCGMLASLRLCQVEEFLRLVSNPVHGRRKMNAPQVLDGMGNNSERRLVRLDSSLKEVQHMVPYFAFWDLSWMPWATSFTLVPMDPATLPLSEKQFASQYFDPSTTFSENVLLWCGKVPFRVEYERKDGTRVVQTETHYEQHKRYREEKGWEVRMRRLPLHEREVWNDMILSWVSSSLTSFLDPLTYDVGMMSRLIVKPLLSKPTLDERVRLAYEVVGRLHPHFPLSRHHHVLRQRIQHLYFSLDKLVEVPIDLLFPEYFLAKETQQKVMDELWVAHLEEFKTRLVVQCARESFDVAGGCTHPTRDNLSVRKSLDRNIYVRENRSLSSLTEEWRNEWDHYFWDEDLIPQGLDALRLFVEAPGYFRHPIPVHRVTETDLLRFLDEWRTMPSYSPYPVYDSDKDSNESSDSDSETEEENTVSEEEDETES